MSGLISRSVLLGRMEDFYIKLVDEGEYKPNYAKAFTMIDDLVKKQPTAYDVEQVVKELEERRKKLIEEGKCLSAEIVRQDIEIVKGGGVDES